MFGFGKWDSNKVYGLVILSSLALLAVAIDAQTDVDFGEETGGPKRG